MLVAATKQDCGDTSNLSAGSQAESRGGWKAAAGSSIEPRIAAPHRSVYGCARSTGAPGSGGLSEWRSARAPASGRGRERVGRVAIDLPMDVAGCCQAVAFTARPLGLRRVLGARPGS